jgi:hypothetical protein
MMIAISGPSRHRLQLLGVTLPQFPNSTMINPDLSATIEDYDDPQDYPGNYNFGPSDGSLLQGPLDLPPACSPMPHPLHETHTQQVFPPSFADNSDLSATIKDYDDPQDYPGNYNFGPSDGSLLQGPLDLPPACSPVPHPLHETHAWQVSPPPSADSNGEEPGESRLCFLCFSLHFLGFGID